MDCTIRVWSGNSGTICQKTVSGVYTMAWIDGTLFAGLETDIWGWSPDQLGAPVPPSFVFDDECCGDYPVAVGLNGELVTGSDIGEISVL
jgi:hypothetical protein